MMVNQKKICIVSTSRADYGLLRWIIDEVQKDDRMLLQLIATGSHLSPEFGLTYTEIENDGYHIDEKVDFIVSSNLNTAIVKSMGICSIGFAEAFGRIKPDILVILGDRYELIPICSAALFLNIPIAHISGGDITEGALDNQVRNVVTMMASIHFPGVGESAKRIERMRGSSSGIYTVGEPGLDNFVRLKLWDRQTIADNLKLDISKKWVLVTYHPETTLSLEENLSTVNNLLKALDYMSDIQVVITGANADFGGSQINEAMQRMAKINSSKYKYHPSLGQIRYLSVMKEVDFIIGNSSSGIVEAPYLAKSVVNIGERQKGRYISKNVINSANNLLSISSAINKAKDNLTFVDNYFGNGNTSVKIVNLIKEFLTL
jgi:UDP-hydrolysing UDP-N-acetyl-D-glucosamine 2-epimerase